MRCGGLNVRVTVEIMKRKNSAGYRPNLNRFTYSPQIDGCDVPSEFKEDGLLLFSYE